MSFSGPSGRLLRTAAAGAASVALICGLLALLVPQFLTTRYEERSLKILRGRAVAIQKEFAALARAAERSLDALTRRPFPATAEAQFDRLKDLGLDQDVEGAALYGAKKRLQLWLGRVINLEDLILGPNPALTPSARPKMVLIEEKASCVLALIHKMESQEIVAVYRLLAFTPELRSAYLKEYSFLPPRLQKGTQLAFYDFREDIEFFERLFARNKDEYVGQPRLRGEVQSLFFPLRTQEGRIIAHVSLNSPTRSANRLAARDGFLLATHVAAAVALIFLALYLIGRPAFRERRPGPTLALLAVLAAFRALFFPLSRLGPASAWRFFSPAQAGFVSLGRLTSSPADIVLTSFVVFAAAALAAFVATRPKRTPASPKGRAFAARRIAAGLSFAAAPFLLAAVDEFLTRLVIHANINLLRFDLSTTFFLLQASVFFVVAGAALLLIVFFRKGFASFGSGWLPVIVLGLSEAAVFLLVKNRPAGTYFLEAAILALFLLLAAGRAGLRRAAAIALVPAAALLVYARLDRATTAKSRALVQGFLKDTVLAHSHWIEYLLSESIQNLDKESRNVLAFLRRPEPPSEIARRLWKRTTASRFNAYSGLQIYDSEGTELARFALNVPKITDETSSLPHRPAWTVTRIAKPFMGKAREFLVGYRDWMDQGRNLGRTVFYISLDYDTLPFLYSANPYYELLRTNALPSLDQFDFRFAVFDNGGRILFNPARLSKGLPAGVIGSADLAGPGVWTKFTDKGQAFDLFAFRAEGRTIALLAARKGFIGRAVDAIKIFLLFGSFVLLSALAWTGAGGSRGRRHFLWSFSSRVYVSFLAVALAPLVLFTLLSRPFFNRIFTQQFIEKAEVHADLARNIMDDFVYLQEEERRLIESRPEDLALYLSTSISNDVNLFLEGRLVSSSRREFFDAGLLPDLLDGEVYYQLQFANDPFAAKTRRLGGFSYQTLTIPYPSLDLPLLISLPFPFEQQEIGGAMRSLVEFLLFLSTIFVGLVALLARTIGSMIVTPIRRLLAGTKAAALGNLDFAIEYGRRDEMKTLIDGFNAMIQSLKDHQRELADLGKKAAWAEMARKVAHEIKNPLTPIQLSAEHLLRVYEEGRGDFNAALKESTAYIIGEVENLRRIAQEFLDLSKASVLHKEVFLLDDFVREIVEPYRKLLGPRVAFRETYGAMTRIEGDKAKLKIAVRNLLINAVESIRGTGEVRVATAEAGDLIEISIEDTGTGIDKDILDRIFEPYFSTKDVGTGLGLPIARKIVEDHGGTIRLESEPGRGTRVAIALPRLAG